MPIDPSVLLYGLQPQARTPYDAPDVVAERRARVEQLREAAKAKQDAEYENQLYDWAVKSNLGPDGTPDFDGVRKSLAAVAPRYLQKFDAAMNTAKKSQAETYKLEDDHRAHEGEFVAQTLGDATAENWPDRYDFLNRTMPGVTSRYGLTREFNPTRNESVIKAATLIPEQNKVKEDARNHQLKGEWDTSIAKEMDALAAAGQLTDDTVADVLKRNQDMGAPVSTRQKWNIPLEQIPPLARTTLVGPHDRALEQQAKDALVQTTRGHDIAEGNLNIAAINSATQAANVASEIKTREQPKPGAGGAGTPGAEIVLKPGTANYRQAQDLADGTLTFQDFQRLHSRAQADAPLRAAIYDTARTLNPNFNPAAFEIGYRYASNPKVKSQIGSIKNVESGVPDLLKASDAATRSGATMLNQYAVRPIQLAVGSKPYTNFKTAITAFADELSGALGYGSATDMSREMGYDMTDMNQSPANFRSNVEEIVLPFVARKKASILGQMGPYADTANTAGKVVTLSELQAIARRKGTTVEQEKARATAAGYTVK
jgi:hypothetical protein